MVTQAGWAGDAGSPDKPVASLATTAAGGALLRPLLGYLRVPSTALDKDVEELRRAIATYARQEGFTLVRILVDRSRKHTAAFAALIKALSSGEAGHVIVPGLHHLTPFPELQPAIKEMFENQTGAHVLVLHPFGETPA